MASQDDVYRKFGITAEAAQLFETELGTLILLAHAFEKGWHVKPDPESARKVSDKIDRHTLGGVLSSLKSIVQLDDNQNIFAGALEARNKLMHGFFEKHALKDKDETDEGRDEMIAELELLHAELYRAWQSASVSSDLVLKAIGWPSAVRH